MRDPQEGRGGSAEQRERERGGVGEGGGRQRTDSLRAVRDTKLRAQYELS